MIHRITSFAGAHAALDRLRPQHMPHFVYSLEHILQAMEFLGNPQDRLRVIQVAGTSGKTSTAYYTAALLTAAGKRVGLSVSPHIYEINERLQIGMRPLPEAVFCDALSEFMGIMKQSRVQLTYFEMLAAFAYWYYAREQVDYAVIEAGMGGLLDATNVVTRPDKVCVITDIGLDHMAYLGANVADITTHKAGIIQLHNAVFCYHQQEALELIRAAARQKQADLHILSDSDTHAEFAALPLFQRRNLGLARAVAAWVLRRDDRRKLPQQAIARAAKLNVPGRMEIVKQAGKTIILDGAHNPQKLETLGVSLRALYPNQSVAVLASFIEARDYRLPGNTAQLARLGEHIIVSGFAAEKQEPHASLAPAVISAALTEAGAKSIETVPVLADALRQLLARPEPILLVTGSLYLLGRVRLLLKSL